MSTTYGQAVKAATIGTDATLSTAISIIGANKVFMEVPTAAAYLYTATCNMYVQVAKESGDTFRRLVAQGVYSGGSGLLDFETPSNAGNFFVELPICGFNHMKAECNNSANSTTFPVKVHMSMLY